MLILQSSCCILLFILFTHRAIAYIYFECFRSIYRLIFLVIICLVNFVISLQVTFGAADKRLHFVEGYFSS